ncbi:MAG: TonB-dependent receptor [Pseudomonadota bacterium]
MKRALFLATTALVGVSSAVPAAAQVDEIIVTSTKREQTLQEVPVAVSVIQEETIEAAQIVDILDLQSIVPSLRVSQLERASNSTFIIRGFGNGANNPGIEPSVAVYVDGVFRTRVGSSLQDFLDLERIEVLKGPQSTLFGKNASSGVVSIVTKKPEYEWAGAVEGTIGNYGQGLAKAYITGPINDTVAFSIAASGQRRDGYAVNVAEGGDYNDRDRYAIRGQLLFQPSDVFEARVIADYDEIAENCCATVRQTDGTGPLIRDVLGGITTAPGVFDYVIANDQPSVNEITNRGISLETTWDLTPNLTVTSVTSGRMYDDFINYEGDFTSLELLGDNVRKLDADTFTQELRIVGSTDRVDYLIGGFYFYEDLDVGDRRTYGEDTRAYVDLLTGGAVGLVEGAIGQAPGTFWAPGLGVDFNATQKDTQFQIFAQFDVAVTDRLTLTAGAAYFQADKEVNFTDVERNNGWSDLNLVAIGTPLISQAAFAQAFFDAFMLPATPDNIAAVSANPAGAAAVAQIQAGSDAFAAANNTNPAVNPLLALPQPLGPLTPFPNSVEDGETSDNDVPITIRAAYDLTDRTNIYLSYATGFKASSWNLTPDTRPFAGDIPALQAAGELASDNAFGLPTIVNTDIARGRYAGTRFAAPETTKTFEFGLKSRFSWGSLNMAVFDQTVEGFQSSIFSGTGFVLGNAGEQSALGVEFDAVIIPPMIEGLTLNISGLFLDSEYDEFDSAAVEVGGPEDALVGDPDDGIGSLTGQTPAGQPDFSGSFGFDYRRDVPFIEGALGFVRADYQYETSVRVVDNVPEDVLGREVNQLNASGGLIFENGVEALVWARNITQDEFFTSGFPTTLQDPSVSGYPNAPRTYGVTVRKRF